MNLLVTTQELVAHLNDPDWFIFDTRHDLGDTEMGRHVYAEDHIPGSFFLHMDDDLSGPKNGRNGRHPLPDQRDFAARMAALGLTRSKHAVVYDDAGGMMASRLWWMLRWLGMGRVMMLDGGYPKWLREGRPVTAQVPVPIPARNDFVLEAGMTVDAGFVLSHLGDSAGVVLDARSPERYLGEQEPLDPVAGHIPGALNRPFGQNLGADGRFKPADQLRSEFEQLLGGRDPATVVHHCGSGVSAVPNVIAMELAGLGPTALYAGSWSEWCRDPLRPVAKG
jgi:thiosulfate/3-mercaptopyruvate sulfurtransferase